MELSTDISNENTCEKPSEPHSSFDIDPTTTTQTIEEVEDLFKMDLENFPVSIIEVMLFKLEENGEIAVQKLFKILSDTHAPKTNALKSWAADIEFARMETVNSESSETSFLVLKIGDCDDLVFGATKPKILPKLAVQFRIT